MLAEYLESLSQLTPIDGVRHEIAVIDNEAEASQKTRETAKRFGARYIHQPDRGIPQARNAALEAAFALGATHLAFIDDDETAASDWLACLWEAMDRFGAGAVQGFVQYVYPAGSPAWRRRGEFNFKKEATGDHLKFGVTNNVLIALGTIGGLRFEESLRFIGGEDVVFFDAFTKRGGKIVFCREAVTFESVPWARLTFWAQLRKAYRRGFCRISQARLMGNPVKISNWKLARRFVTGAAKILISPLLLLVSRQLGLHAIMSGGRNVASSIGSAAAYLGGSPLQYYRNPTGH